MVRHGGYSQVAQNFVHINIRRPWLQSLVNSYNFIYKSSKYANTVDLITTLTSWYINLTAMHTSCKHRFVHIINKHHIQRDSAFAKDAQHCHCKTLMEYRRLHAYEYSTYIILYSTERHQLYSKRKCWIANWTTSTHATFAHSISTGRCLVVSLSLVSSKLV